MREPSARTVIIGAGPAGLACAFALSKNGHSAVVVEQDKEVGGRCRADQAGGRGTGSDRLCPAERIRGGVRRPPGQRLPGLRLGLPPPAFPPPGISGTIRQFPGHRPRGALPLRQFRPGPPDRDPRCREHGRRRPYRPLDLRRQGIVSFFDMFFSPRYSGRLPGRPRAQVVPDMFRAAHSNL